MKSPHLRVLVKKQVSWLPTVTSRLQALGESLELVFEMADFSEKLSDNELPIVVSDRLPDFDEITQLQKISLKFDGLIWITDSERMSDELIKNCILSKIEIWSSSWPADFMRFRALQCLAALESRRHEQEKQGQLVEILSLQRALNTEWQKLSLVDELTGCPNRRAFEEQFEKDWALAMREGNDLSIIMVDIDHFKIFNDEFGHQRGDEILQIVAEKCRACVRRPGDLFARLGGEEFIALLPRTSAMGALVVAEAMRSVIREAKIEQGKGAGSEYLSLSAGIASLSQDGLLADAPEQLVKAADDALYRAKQAGRNSSFLWADQPVLEALSRQN